MPSFPLTYPVSHISLCILLTLNAWPSRASINITALNNLMDAISPCKALWTWCKLTIVIYWTWSYTHLWKLTSSHLNPGLDIYKVVGDIMLHCSERQREHRGQQWKGLLIIGHPFLPWTSMNTSFLWSAEVVYNDSVLVAQLLPFPMGVTHPHLLIYTSTYTHMSMDTGYSSPSPAECLAD